MSVDLSKAQRGRQGAENMSEKTALDNIYGIRINNIQRTRNAHVYSSPAPHRCTFILKVRHEPKFIYHDLGRFLVAHDENTGFVGSYEYKRGTTDGFAGREIRLPIIGGGVVFPKLGRSFKSYKGSLWDTVGAKRAAEELFGFKTVSVAYLPINSRYDVGLACEMHERIFTRILQLAGLRLDLNEDAIFREAV
jgi:hypothetical protein